MSLKTKARIMKRLFYMVMPVMMVTVGCSKTFIDVDPVSTATVDAVYRTEKDFQDATIGCYKSLATQYQSFWQFGDIRGDDSEAQMFKSNTVDYINNFTIDNTAGVLNTSWQNYYQLINRTNTVLERIADADAGIVKNKDRYIGEALFLRALAYFDLVRIFGDVPLITKVIAESESYSIPRTAVGTIYSELIIKDLKEAETKLPVNYTGAEIGRATRGAAKALLGRVYLTTHDFVSAETKLQEVTTLGYSLLPEFKDLFDYSKDEHHKEYIFDVEYEEIINAGASFTHDFCPRVPAVLASYGIKGQGGDNQNPTAQYIALFDAADKRKYTTVATTYKDASGNEVALPPNQVLSYTRKYMTPVSIQGNSKTNWKLIRYADVLLMYAEALNENGKTPEALSFLNQIRARAGVAQYSGLSKDDTREKIYLERRLELGFEGHRWFDLVRTGRALSTMQSFGMKAYMTVFPIPLVQIQVINDPSILDQNEGYD
jgi:hypothetical protein